MANKAFHIAAICCAILGCVVLIAAMGSVSWMIACIHLDNMFKAMKGYSLTQNISGLQQSENMFKGRDLCIHLGLFKFSMDVGGLIDMSFGINLGKGSIIFGAIAMAVAVIFGVAGTIALLAAVGRSSKSYEEKSVVSSRTRAAMILLSFAGLIGIVGMVSYSVGTGKALQSPVQFMALVGQSGASSFQKILSNSSIGRGKRDLSLAGLDPEIQQYMNTMLADMDPHYGYAFMLGWFAIIMLMIATVLSAVARIRLVSRSYDGCSSAQI